MGDIKRRPATLPKVGEISCQLVVKPVERISSACAGAAKLAATASANRDFFSKLFAGASLTSD